MTFFRNPVPAYCQGLKSSKKCDKQVFHNGFTFKSCVFHFFHKLLIEPKGQLRASVAILKLFVDCAPVLAI